MDNVEHSKSLLPSYFASISTSALQASATLKAMLLCSVLQLYLTMIVGAHNTNPWLQKDGTSISIVPFKVDMEMQPPVSDYICVEMHADALPPMKRIEGSCIGCVQESQSLGKTPSFLMLLCGVMPPSCCSGVCSKPASFMRPLLGQEVGCLPTSSLFPEYLPDRARRYLQALLLEHSQRQGDPMHYCCAVV